MVQVNFQKRFVSGCLKGITIPDTISFATKSSAKAYIKGFQKDRVRDNKRGWGSGYIAGLFEIQETK